MGQRFINLYTFICFVWSSKLFYSPSFGAFYATKIVQIDEGMSEICLFQVKGVMPKSIYIKFASTYMSCH
jgi:hypothetical protein